MFGSHAETPARPRPATPSPPLARLLDDRLWGWLEALIRVVAPLAVLIVSGLPTFVGVVLVQELGLWLVRRCWPGDAFLRRLFVAAFGARLALAIALFLLTRGTTLNGAVLQDDYANDVVADWLLRIARGEGLSLFEGQKHVLDTAYPFGVLGLYAVFGYAPLLPKAVNAGMGALAAVVIARIASQLFRPTAGRLAGVAAALMPSLVFWSALTLKETAVLLAITLALLALLLLVDRAGSARARWNGLVLLAGMLLALADLRPAALALVATVFPPVPLVWLRGRQRLAYVGAGLAVAAVGGGVVLAVIQARGQSDLLRRSLQLDAIAREIRHRRAWEAVSARSQIGAEVDAAALQTEDPLPAGVQVRSDAEPFDLVSDVVEPLAFGLLAPAPWQARGLRGAAASAEMLAWYVLLAGALASLAAKPGQSGFAVILALFGIETWLLLSFSEGNLGNLFRHRIMLAPALLPLGSGGLAWLWKRARGRRAAVSSAGPGDVAGRGSAPPFAAASDPSRARPAAS